MELKFISGKHSGLIILLVGLLLTGQISSGQTIRITAAADLRYALAEVVENYKKSNPDVKIDVAYGSSGNAFTQICNNAPFDIYFSADISYPQKLKDLGLTISEPKLYAIGRIVLWSNSIDVSKGPEILTGKSITKVAIANPEHAPYGKRAEESLKYYKLYDQVKPKLILGENVSQAAQFITTGNAEAGIIALSLALSPSLREKGSYFLIDNSSHQPLEQAYVILKQAQGNQAVHKFAEYVSTAPARNVLKKYGFVLPGEIN
jgi:molybdate transport system substrate-binding protein